VLYPLLPSFSPFWQYGWLFCRNTARLIIVADRCFKNKQPLKVLVDLKVVAMLKSMGL
jgi:hypothetical protein